MEGAGRGNWKEGIRAVVDWLAVKQTWGGGQNGSLP